MLYEVYIRQPEVEATSQKGVAGIIWKGYDFYLRRPTVYNGIRSEKRYEEEKMMPLKRSYVNPREGQT